MASRSKINHTERPVRRVSRCNVGAIKKAARRISLMYDQTLGPTGLKMTQHGILSEINYRGATLPAMRELAEALVMDRSTLGQNLRPLERDGLITILTDPRDRRSRLIGLTKRGLAKLNEAANYWETAQAHFEEVVGEQEAADLRTVLTAIAHNPKLGERG